MRRILSVAAAAAMLGLMPELASAQQMERTKEIKDAERFIATSMIAPDSAEKRARLEKALNPLRLAMTKTPENALVWLTAGQVLVGLGQFAAADSALDRAEALNPAVAEDAKKERINAWSAAFEQGLSYMDTQKYDEAIAIFETAESVYPERPESKLNLGMLYLNRGDLSKAEATFRDVVELSEGPVAATLGAEEAGQWQRFAALGRLKIGEITAQRGVDAFDAKRFDDAITAFAAAREVNPHARDFIYNLAQSTYARARELEEERIAFVDEEAAARAKKNATLAAEKKAAAAKLGEQIFALYEKLEPQVDSARVFDPNNPDLFQLLMRAHRVRGEMAANAATRVKYQQKIDELIKFHQTIKAEIVDLNVQTLGSEAAVRGSLKNLKATPGEPVRVLVTLLGVDGKNIGEQEITVAAPAVSETAAFEAKIPITADLAGRKYVIR